MIRTIILCLTFSLVYGAHMSGQNSGISMGRSEATGEASFAAGDTSLAQGKASAAIGLKAKAIGDFSFAIGNNTYAGGAYSFAAGQFANTSAPGAIAIGTSSAQAPNSVAMGINNITRPSAAGAAAFGAGNNIFGDAGFAAGQQNVSHSFGEIVLGLYSQEYDSSYVPTPNSYQPLDRLFVVGNGTNDSNRSNALTMLKNGDTDMSGNLKLQKTLTVGEDTTQTDFVEGQIRYNQLNRDLEGYTPSGWHSLTNSNIPVAQRGDWLPKTEGNLKDFNNDLIDAFMWFVNDNGTRPEGSSVDNRVVANKPFEILSKKWSTSFDVGNIASSSKGRLPGAPILNEITVLFRSQKGSDALALLACTGEMLSELHIPLYRGSDFNTPPRLYYIMKDVVVENFEYLNNVDQNNELNRVTMRFASMKVESTHTTQTNTTSVDHIFEWNQIENTSNNNGFN